MAFDALKKTACKAFNNNNNNNKYPQQCLWCYHHDHSHCESSPGLSDECRLSARWLPAPRPSQSIWVMNPPKIGSYHPKQPSPWLLLLSPQVDTHFTVPRKVEGWVDLGTAVRCTVKKTKPILYLGEQQDCCMHTEQTHQVKDELGKHSSLAVDDRPSSLLFAALKHHECRQLSRPRRSVHQKSDRDTKATT